MPEHLTELLSFTLAAGLSALITYRWLHRRADRALRAEETERAIEAIHLALDDLKCAVLRHAGLIDRLVASNNNMSPDVRDLRVHAHQLDANFERLLQINEATIDVCAAAQRFYDVLTGRGQVPEQELKELGQALDDWQRKGRLN